MAMNDVLAKCTKCKNEFMTILNDAGALYKSEQTCEDCGAPMQVVKFEDIQDPDTILNWAESELESANYHSMTSMPVAVYQAVFPFVKEEDRPAVARAIAVIFVREI